MAFIDSSEAFERYRREARNSSHFIWFLANLKFFKADANGFIFGFTQVGRVTFIALEPLVSAPLVGPVISSESFQVAWKEFRQAVQPQVCAFVGIYSPFAEILRSQGFQTLQVGREPWLDLDHCIPKGNAGKGVRASRNQALHAGLRIEEWVASELEKNPERKAALLALYHEWRSRNLVDVGGFLNACDPLAYIAHRKHFVALSTEGRLEGFLIATPVAAIQGYFLEDLVLRSDHQRGAGELLMLEAMVALRETGAKIASLGVISVNSIDSVGAHGLPKSIQLFVVKIPALLRRIYNFDGLMTFRKRFKPTHWESIHLAVENHSSSGRSDTRAWWMVLTSMIFVFQPRLRPSWRWLKDTAFAPWKKHPFSWGLLSISLLLFAFVNRFGELPESALRVWGFTASAPLWEWLHRSVSSDFLYFNFNHLLACLIPYFILMRWAERAHRFSFLAPFLIALSVFDDWINYAVIVRPFQFLRPGLYEQLIMNKDVGGSLGLATLLGLQLCQLKKNREIVFAVLAMFSVFGFLFSSGHLFRLVVDLNHFLFLSLGFVVGKLKFESERKNNRKNARAKPPTAKSVAQPRSSARNQNRSQA